MRKLGLDTLDLYLLHQPMPNEWERTAAAWKAAERLLAEGRTRAIGLSNFSTKHLADLSLQLGRVEGHSHLAEPAVASPLGGSLLDPACPGVGPERALGRPPICVEG